MEKQYPERQVRTIAEECREFEHVINAMGYGYSLLNVSEDKFIRRCPDCVNWLGGSCGIFRDEIREGQA
ncbi:MAG TPA: hypothetical protein PKA10_07110 [Selenomonadales bacterium]|nr:hypothetical protein [Selenomonadales bacterium]